MSVSLVTDQSVRKAYEADASGLHLVPEFVARPESTEQVIEVMRLATADRMNVTCAGAQTSTTGASITDSGILLSLRSLDEISPVDVKSKTVSVGPGALIGDIKRAAAAAGLLFAPDPTSEEESTIGGAIACNASGARTFKYGPTRQHVESLKIVMANGELREFRRSNLVAM